MFDYQSENRQLREENRRLRTAMAHVLVCRYTPKLRDQAWWWLLEDALGLPRTDPDRPSGVAVAPPECQRKTDRA